MDGWILSYLKCKLNLKCIILYLCFTNIMNIRREPDVIIGQSKPSGMLEIGLDGLFL
jgi:hypothetical protein